METGHEFVMLALCGLNLETKLSNTHFRVHRPFISLISFAIRVPEHARRNRSTQPAEDSLTNASSVPYDQHCYITYPTYPLPFFLPLRNTIRLINSSSLPVHIRGSTRHNLISVIHSQQNTNIHRKPAYNLIQHVPLSVRELPLLEHFYCLYRLPKSTSRHVVLPRMWDAQ